MIPNASRTTARSPAAVGRAPRSRAVGGTGQGGTRGGQVAAAGPSEASCAGAGERSRMLCVRSILLAQQRPPPQLPANCAARRWCHSSPSPRLHRLPPRPRSRALGCAPARNGAFVYLKPLGTGGAPIIMQQKGAWATGRGMCTRQCSLHGAALSAARPRCVADAGAATTRGRGHVRGRGRGRAGARFGACQHLRRRARSRNPARAAPMSVVASCARGAARPVSPAGVHPAPAAQHLCRRARARRPARAAPMSAAAGCARRGHLVPRASIWPRSPALASARSRTAAGSRGPRPAGVLRASPSSPFGLRAPAV